MKKIVLIIIFLQTTSINSAQYFSSYFKDIVLKTYDFKKNDINKEKKLNLSESEEKQINEWEEAARKQKLKENEIADEENIEFQQKEYDFAQWKNIIENKEICLSTSTKSIYDVYLVEQYFNRLSHKTRKVILVQQAIELALSYCKLKNVEYAIIDDPHAGFYGLALCNIKKIIINIGLSNSSLNFLTFVIYHECGHLVDSQFKKTMLKEHFADLYSCKQLIKKRDFNAINAFMLECFLSMNKYGDIRQRNAVPFYPTYGEQYNFLKEYLNKEGFEIYTAFENEKFISLIYEYPQIGKCTILSQFGTLS